MTVQFISSMVHPNITYSSTTDYTDYGVSDTATPYMIKCNIYRNERNNTFILANGYAGIPENLLINFITWIILLMLFTVLRKRAWNYGRIALVHMKEQRWTQLFYGNVEAAPTIPGDDAKKKPRVSLDLSDVLPYHDKGFCSWLWAIFKLRDRDILEKSGLDAIQYLSFQRHVILYSSIVCVIALAVILPVNFQGDLEGNSNTFGHTTISNLDPKSNYLWFHVAFSFLLFPVGICVMRRFSRNLIIEEQETMVTRTLMITHIPKMHCKRNNLIQHFQEAYPEVEVQDIQFAYDIKKLNKFDDQRESSAQARIWCERYYKATGSRPRMRPYTCGHFCSCCKSCGCQEVDAIDYYSEEEASLAAKVDEERTSSLQCPLGVAFVTFVTESMAVRIYKDHQHSCKCSSNPPSSSLSCILAPHDWGVTFAPPPEDFIWENLSSSSETWYIWVFFVNFALFMALFFLTTPAIVINSLNVFTLTDRLNQFNPLLSEFIPTLLLWLIAALLPIIVAYSDQFVFHWTRSAQNHAIMQKTFIFLVFMVLVLPSLGLTSMKAFVLWAAAPRNTTYRWECIFLPNNGAFFVNYVITSAFIGTAAELIRFPELFMYVLRLCFARSSAEQASVRKAILWEFQFGVQYAWFLLIFAVTMMYSLSCPLIVPFGLVYMFLKHCVDRYNIYFAYGPSKINKNIHATAINFVIFSIILLQLSMVFFSFLRKGWKPILIVSLAGFVFTLAIFFGQVFFHWFKQFSPITYKRLACEGGSEIDAPEVFESASESDPSKSLVSGKAFVPDVLSYKSSFTEEPIEELSSSSHNTRHNYGTADPTEIFVNTDDNSSGYQKTSNNPTLTSQLAHNKF